MNKPFGGAPNNAPNTASGNAQPGNPHQSPGQSSGGVPFFSALTAGAAPMLAATLEVALNRTLRLEPAVLRECERLNGRMIALVLKDWDLQLIIELMPTGVRVLTQAPASEAPHVRVSATTPRLLGVALRLATGESLDAVSHPSSGQSTIDQGLPAGLDIHGDTALLQTFAGLLKRVDLDPEELLAQVLPEAAAHRVAQTLHDFLGFGKRASRRFAEDASEYLREETGDLVGGNEVEEWTRDIEALRERVDRLDARIGLVERRRQTAKPTPSA